MADPDQNQQDAEQVDETTRQSMEQAARNAGQDVPTTSGDHDPDQQDEADDQGRSTRKR